MYTPVKLTTTRIKQSPQPLVVVGFGLPSKLKKAVLSELAAQLDAPLITEDTIEHKLREERQGTMSPIALAHEVSQVVGQHLQTKGLVVVNTANCHRMWRQKTTEQFRQLGALTIGGVWVKTPLETVLAPTQSPHFNNYNTTMTYMQDTLDRFPPALSDGFDWLQQIEPDLSTSDAIFEHSVA